MQNLLGNSKCLIDNKHDNVKLIGFLSKAIFWKEDCFL